MGSRLTVAQFAQIYRWRGVYDFAGRAWSIWRIARMINPATAATYEMRERLSKSIMHWVKDTITGRLSRAYIQEVGAAAVDLYSGELRRASPARPSAADAVSRQIKSFRCLLRNRDRFLLIAGFLGGQKISCHQSRHDQEWQEGSQRFEQRQDDR